MRSWLAKRRSGEEIMHDLDEKTSCLRPARSNTYRQSLQTNREKVEKCLDVMSAMESNTGISQPPPAAGALSQPLLAAAPTAPAEMALPSPDAAATGADGLVSAPQQRQPPPQQQQRSFAQNRAAMLQQQSRCSKCKMGLGKCRHLGLPGHLQSPSTAPAAPAPAVPAATPEVADCDLCCDTCDGWFRASNVGLSVREAEALQEWHCAACLGQPQPQPQPGSDGIDRAAAVQATGRVGHWFVKAVHVPGKVQRFVSSEKSPKPNACSPQTRTRRLPRARCCRPLPCGRPPGTRRRIRFWWRKCAIT